MKKDESKKDGSFDFQPLELMGYFWLVFGVIVLLATVFVGESSLVPKARGVMTNILAGLVLFLTGLFSVIRGRSNKKKQIETK
ncbi:MAG: hypothetical protein V2J62_02690 [candidate division KSB1 bacterium]|jgi:predicted metal-binding membrane protein|nr:hypothetical protein [candidate division KSB1 bacterium]